MRMFAAFACLSLVAWLPQVSAQVSPTASRGPLQELVRAHDELSRSPAARLAQRRARAQSVFAQQAGLAASVPEDAARNVILVVLDDVGIDRLASYDALGSVPAPTPFLDVVAEHSLVFDRAYAQPVCSPSRMGALTGLRPTRTQVGTVFLWANSQNDPYNLDLTGLASLPLQVSATGTHIPVAVGKWHMNNILHEPNPFVHPIDFGFHEFRGSMTSVLLSESYYDYPYTVATKAGAFTAQENTYATTKQIDDALDVIKSVGNQPFVMWFALHAPHTPWEAPPAELLSGELGALNNDDKLFRAMLEAADTELLRFFESLRPAVLARSVVVIVGDNGTPAASFLNPSSQVFNGFKGNVGERGVHVPMFVWAHDVNVGRTPALTHTDDLYATTLDLIGGDASPGLDSVSFAPVIFGAAGERTHVYAARHRPNGAGPYNKDVSTVIGETFKLQRDVNTFRLFKLNALPNSQTWLQPPFSENQKMHFDELKALMLEIEG